MTDADVIKLELIGDGKGIQDEPEGRHLLSNKWILVQVQSK